MTDDRTERIAKWFESVKEEFEDFNEVLEGLEHRRLDYIEPSSHGDPPSTIFKSKYEPLYFNPLTCSVANCKTPQDHVIRLWYKLEPGSLPRADQEFLFVCAQHQNLSPEWRALSKGNYDSEHPDTPEEPTD